MNSKNEAESEPKAMKSQSDDRISNIATMDNGTMVESFKFLNYRQLAMNSLVSKRYWNLIRTHRHSLALLDIKEIRVYINRGDPVSLVIKMFNEELSFVEYNKWIDRNGYSTQAPEKESTYVHKLLMFIARALFEALAAAFPRQIERSPIVHEFNAKVQRDPNDVFFAKVELKDETWPVFQHFFRLIMDPFIYIRSFEWNDVAYKKEFFCFLTLAMNPYPGRFQCEQLNIRFCGDTQKFMAWIKDHVRCDEFTMSFDSDSNYAEELLDFFMTGAPCTSSIFIRRNDLSKIIVDFVQKFMDLKSRDEYQVVELIRGYVKDQQMGPEISKRRFDFNLDELNRKYAECFWTISVH